METLLKNGYQSLNAKGMDIQEPLYGSAVITNKVLTKDIYLDIQKWAKSTLSPYSPVAKYIVNDCESFVFEVLYPIHPPFIEHLLLRVVLDNVVKLLFTSVP